MPHLRHLNKLNTARAINFSCYHRYHLLQGDEIIMPFIDELNRARDAYNINILGYVIMPNHVHFVLHPLTDCDLGRIIGEIKSRSAGRILRVLKDKESPLLDLLQINKRGQKKQAFWQARCYDHNCRSIETVREKINYCHMNPVKAGLVAKPGDWKWSSYRWYQGLDDIALEIDGIDL